MSAPPRVMEGDTRKFGVDLSLPPEVYDREHCPCFGCGVWFPSRRRSPPLGDRSLVELLSPVMVIEGLGRVQLHLQQAFQVLRPRLGAGLVQRLMAIFPSSL
eukprot:gene3257-3768_t